MTDCTPVSALRGRFVEVDAPGFAASSELVSIPGDALDTVTLYVYEGTAVGATTIVVMANVMNLNFLGPAVKKVLDLEGDTSGGDTNEADDAIQNGMCRADMNDADDPRSRK